MYCAWGELVQGNTPFYLPQELTRPNVLSRRHQRERNLSPSLLPTLTWRDPSSSDTVISCRTLLQGMDVRWQLGDCALQPSGPRLQEAASLQLP